MAIWKDCPQYETCRRMAEEDSIMHDNFKEMDILHCEDCYTFQAYKQGVIDGAKQAIEKVNEMISDGWFYG